MLSEDVQSMKRMSSEMRRLKGLTEEVEGLSRGAPETGGNVAEETT